MAMDNLAHSTAGDRVALAAKAIRDRWSASATTAVILGTGLGALADGVTAEAAITYREIPGFPHCSALAHRGRLVCGRLKSVPIVMLQGRCHRYEGYEFDELAFPVRVLAALGVKTLIVTNAAGGLNPRFAKGDIMLIDDHINLMGVTPAIPWNESMLARSIRPLYDCELADVAQRTARRGDFPLCRGVYVAVRGPSYETRAEYRAFRRIGGDCVGMSTVPEVLAAATCGLRALGLSTITNVACPDAPKTVSAEDVVQVAAKALPKVRQIVEQIVVEQGQG